MKVTVTPEIRAVLERSTITANSVTLPQERLANYKQVNAVLEAAGGKWNKKAKCHLFPVDPRAALGLALESGQIVHQEKARKKERQAFYTPDTIAESLVAHASVTGQRVLEPSAGHGAIATVCRQNGAAAIDCVEIDPEACQHLRREGFNVVFEGDFLATAPSEPEERYDRIVMNPPFTRKADAKHVRHALFNWLADGGTLTAIVCDDGQDRPRPDLAAIHRSYKILEKLPAGAFRESGTMIRTLIVQFTR